MKTASCGRIIFGVSGVLFGVIALMWNDSHTWQILIQIWHPRFGAIIGGFLMIAQIVGGIGVLHLRSARLASIVLGVVYLLFSLASISNIIATPKIYATQSSLFARFSLLCGAIALYAATEPNAARAATFGRAARLGLGSCAISFALTQAIYHRETASLVPKWIPPDPMFWAILTTIAFARAAIAILVNRQTEAALRLMTLMLSLFGVLVWIPRLIARPRVHLNWSEFALSFLITGAVWIVADLNYSDYDGNATNRVISGLETPEGEVGAAR